MRTLLENLKEDERSAALRGVKCAGRYVANDIGQAIAEIERLNQWADGFSDAQLKERRLCEARIQELQLEITRLRRTIGAA